MAELFWIWSNEHSAWWGPGRYGYVRTLAEAGIYDAAEAAAIVASANLTQGATIWFKRNEVAFAIVVPDEPVTP